MPWHRAPRQGTRAPRPAHPPQSFASTSAQASHLDANSISAQRANKPKETSACSQTHRKVAQHKTGRSVLQLLVRVRVCCAFVPCSMNHPAVSNAPASIAPPLVQPHVAKPEPQPPLPSDLPAPASASPAAPVVWDSSRAHPLVLALKHSSLDSPSRAAVAQTCKAVLERLLAEWPAAVLCALVGPGEDTAALRRRMQSARRQLALRGSLPTTLALQQRGAMGSEDTWWQTALPELSVAMPQLVLRLSFQHIPAELLSLADQAMSGLTTLELCSPDKDTVHWKLPWHPALPAMRHLVLRCGRCATNVWYMASLYLPQLESIEVGSGVDVWSLWPRFGKFHADVSQTLKRVVLDCRLEPTLVARLQRCAPALEELTVGGLSTWVMGSGVQPVCSWKVLRGPLKGLDFFETLDWLPEPAEGSLTWDFSGTAVPIWLPVTAEVRALPGMRIAYRAVNSMQLTHMARSEACCRGHDLCLIWQRIMFVLCDWYMHAGYRGLGGYPCVRTQRCSHSQGQCATRATASSPPHRPLTPRFAAGAGGHTRARRL